MVAADGPGTSHGPAGGQRQEDQLGEQLWDQLGDRPGAADG